MAPSYPRVPRLSRHRPDAIDGPSGPLCLTRRSWPRAGRSPREEDPIGSREPLDTADHRHPAGLSAVLSPAQARAFFFFCFANSRSAPIFVQLHPGGTRSRGPSAWGTDCAPLCIGTLVTPGARVRPHCSPRGGLLDFWRHWISDPVDLHPRPLAAEPVCEHGWRSRGPSCLARVRLVGDLLPPVFAAERRDGELPEPVRGVPKHHVFRQPQ